MIKCNSPFVKVLRKAGFRNKDAMLIALRAWEEYTKAFDWNAIYFNRLAVRGDISSMFTWSETEEGHDFWLAIQRKFNPWW